MTRGRKISLRVALVSVFSLIVFVQAYAYDDPFKTVVKHIEHDYNARKSGVPLLGVANFVLKFWHPAGVKNVKVAMFDNQDLTPRPGSPDFNSVVTTSAAGGWQALARVYSREKSQWTYVYYTDAGKDMRILIVNLEHQSAIVAQVRFDAEKLVEFVQNPEILGVKLADDIRQGPQDNGGSPSSGSQSTKTALVLYHSEDGCSNGILLRNSESPKGAKQETSPPTLIRGERPEADAAELAAPLGLPPTTAFPSTDAHSSADTTGPAHLGATAESAIKLETRLVNLNIQATDGSGKPVTGLTKDDFEVWENGDKQSVAYFSPSTSPVNVLLLLDLSGSTKKKSKTMKAAAERFVEKLSDGDKVAVATFTRKFRVVSDFSSDRRLVADRIKHIKNKEGGTAYYDAMWTAFNMTDEVGGPRKAIIVLSDGVDNSLQNPKEWPTNHRFSELADRASEDEVTVYPLYMDTEHDKGAWVGRRTGEIYQQARGELQRLADDTAGSMYRVSDKDDLKSVYEKVAAELHTIYTLAYSPKEIVTDGKFRKVKVVVKEQGVVTRTRKGYYAK